VGRREGGELWRFLSEWVLLREVQPCMSLRVFLSLRRTHNYQEPPLSNENKGSQMKTRGRVSYCDLAIYIKKYLTAKEELWKIHMFQHAKT
jgi:hypothetical protein